MKTPREKHALDDTPEVQPRTDLLAPPHDPKVLLDPLEYVHGGLHEVTVSLEGVDFHGVDETVAALRAEHAHYS